MIDVDETARVDPRAEIGDGVLIGPYCVVGRDVKIGRGTKLISHVCLLGLTSLGESNVLGPCVIGGDPQDISYRGSPTRVEIGGHNVIGEGVTIHRASEKEDGLTRIGHHNILMAGSHVAHDCKLDDHIRMSDGVMLGGHVHVQSHASLETASAVHHYVTVGGYSLVAAKSKITHDVPPYMFVVGNPSGVRRVNLPILKQSGMPKEEILALREAHRLIFRGKASVQHASEVLEARDQLTPGVRHLLDFLRSQQSGRRGRARDREK